MRLFSFLRGHRSRTASAPPGPSSSPRVTIDLPPPPPRPALTSTKQPFTQVDLPWLSLRLPGESWARSGNANAFEYVSPLTDEQLIVMVVPLAQPLGIEQQRAALEILIDNRREAVATLSDGLAEFSPLEHRQGGGQHEIRLAGVNHKSNIQFAFLARAAPGAFVNLSLYRYNVNPNPTPFAFTAQRIFDRLEIRSPSSSPYSSSPRREGTSAPPDSP
jgi:hypothetical protein